MITGIATPRSYEPVPKYRAKPDGSNILQRSFDGATRVWEDIFTAAPNEDKVFTEKSLSAHGSRITDHAYHSFISVRFSAKPAQAYLITGSGEIQWDRPTNSDWAKVALMLHGDEDVFVHIYPDTNYSVYSLFRVYIHPANQPETVITASLYAAKIHGVAIQPNTAEIKVMQL